MLRADRILRLRAEWPADPVESRSACSLDLDFHGPAVAVQRLNREDVCAFNTVPRHRGCPAPTRELGRRVVFTDGLGLLCVYHAAILPTVLTRTVTPCGLRRPPPRDVD